MLKGSFKKRFMQLIHQFFTNLKCNFREVFFGIGFILAFIPSAMAVNAQSAVGYWQTRDDETGKATSIIQIWQNPSNQKYYGKVYKIFPVLGHKTTDSCPLCPGKLKNRPMLGLTIIRDMTYADGKYIRGYVLDPQIGKLYHAEMRVTEDGKILKLRGYIGIPLFGRTAEWERTRP